VKRSQAAGIAFEQDLRGGLFCAQACSAGVCAGALPCTTRARACGPGPARERVPCQLARCHAHLHRCPCPRYRLMRCNARFG